MGKISIKDKDTGNSLSIETNSLGTNKTITPEDFKYIRDTIKDLKDLRGKLTHGDVVFIKGYHNVGDQGSGIFIYNENKSKSDHDGGTIIDPDKDFPIDWGNEELLDNWFNNINDGYGVLERVYSSNEIKVSWYGGIDDENINSSSSIQKAIDFAYSKQDYIVRVDGRYGIKYPIRLKQGVHLLGYGIRKSGFKALEDMETVKENVYVNSYSVDITGKKVMLYNEHLITQAKIGDLRLDGNSVADYGFYINELYYTYIPSLNIYNCLSSGFTVIKAQFNKIGMLTHNVNGGPIRIISGSNNVIDLIDIEKSMSKNILIIGSNISVTTGNVINSIRVEEPDGGVYETGDIINICEKGLVINSLYGNFYGTNDERYINLGSISFNIDGLSLSLSASYYNKLNLTYVGNVKITYGDSFNNTITGSVLFDRAGFSKQFNVNGVVNYDKFKVISDTSEIITCLEDGLSIMGKNIRNIGGNLYLENAYGRVVIKVGSGLKDFIVQNNEGSNMLLVEDSDDGTVVKFYNLPTSDPGVAGQIWNDNGTLKISQG